MTTVTTDFPPPPFCARFPAAEWVVLGQWFSFRSSNFPRRYGPDASRWVYGARPFFTLAKFSPPAVPERAADHAALFGKTFPASEPIRRVPFSASDGEKVAAGRMRCALKVSSLVLLFLAGYFSVRVFVPLCLWGATFPKTATFRAGTQRHPFFTPGHFSPPAI